MHVLVKGLHLATLVAAIISTGSTPSVASPPEGPPVIRYNVQWPDGSPWAAPTWKAVERYRRDAGEFIFLSGGASKMTTDAQAQLLGLFDAFRILSSKHLHFAVGDGGTKAGIMEAAGLARIRSKNGFLLIGVSPEPEITETPDEPGKTPIDPGHSDVVAVINNPWLEAQRANGWEPSWGYWGSETEAMYKIFGRLADRRPSVTIVANGGGITLDEVRQNVLQKRNMIVIWGSGRVADAICEAVLGLPHTPSPEPKVEEEFSKLLDKVHKANLPKDLFTAFNVGAGPEAFAVAIYRRLQYQR